MKLNDEQDRRARISKKAENRGNATVEWLKSHKLTSETMKEFKSLMKRVDKEFDKNEIKKTHTQI